jgi:hypothetical protein
MKYIIMKVNDGTRNMYYIFIYQKIIKYVLYKFRDLFIIFKYISISIRKYLHIQRK